MPDLIAATATLPPGERPELPALGDGPQEYVVGDCPDAAAAKTLDREAVRQRELGELIERYAIARQDLLNALNQRPDAIRAALAEFSPA